MAERRMRRQKGSAERVRVHVEIDAESKLYLIEVAGEMSLGWAVEQLIRSHKIWAKRTVSAQELASRERVQ